MALDPDKRDRILDAATDLFARFGFKKTSIDEIAAAAGVGKGTVYLMSKSKEDLFFQVVHREIRRWVAYIGEILDPRAPADELIVRSQLASMEYVASRPLVRDLLLGNYEETLPLWVAELEDLRTIARKRNEDVLQLGIRQGRFRPDLDVPVVSKILQDLHASWLLIASRDTRPPEIRLREAQVGVDLVLNGLRKR